MRPTPGRTGRKERCMQDESRNDLLEIGVTEIGFADALYAILDGNPDSCSSCASCWSLCCSTI